MKNDLELLEEFVATFDKLSEMAEFTGIYPIVSELAVGELDEFGHTKWQPSPVKTERRFLDDLYAKLPGRLPPLFETLLLFYRWADVDLQLFTLLANPPAPDLSRFYEQISGDPGLWKCLIPSGYIRFAKGPDMDYDPVCFDIKRRRNNKDCPVVKIDHEEILCNNRIKVVGELAPGFRELVQQTIDKAKSV